MVRRHTRVVARLHEHGARGVRRRAVPAFGAAATRPRARLSTLVRSIGRVGRCGQDRLTRHRAAEAEDVRPAARLRGQGDPAGLRRDPAVGADERPLRSTACASRWTAIPIELVASSF